jgi:hypothetical protein
MSIIHHHSGRRGLLLVLALGIAGGAAAQFTYFGGGLTNTSAKYSTFYPGAKEGDEASHKVLDLAVQGLYRPLHNLGIGIGVGLPLSDKSDWDYRRTNLFSGGSTFIGFPTAGLAGYRYVPQVYDYTFERSLATTVNVRVFAGTKVDPYLDVRMSFYTVQENFRFERAEVFSNDDGGYIPATSFAFEHTHAMNPLGFSVGVMPRFKGGLFLDMSVGVDLLNFDSPGFQLTVEHNWDYATYRHELVDLTNHAQGSVTAFRMNVGLGYFF